MDARPVEPRRGLAALRFGLFAIVLLSPLPFGSVQPRSVLGIELAAAMLGGLALWFIVREPATLAGRTRLLLVPAIGLLLIGVIQLVPLPAAWVSAVAPQTGQARAALQTVLPEALAGSYPLSLAPPETADALLRLSAYLLIGLAAVVALRRPAHLTQAAIVVMLSGALQAFYGSFEFLSGRQHILGYAKRYYLDDATGTFINRNHFAGYLAMALPLALAIFSASRSPSSERRDLRSRLLRLTEPGLQLRVVAAFSVFGIWVGLLLSNSRAGLAAGLVATAIAGTIIARYRRGVLLVAAALLLPTFFLLYLHVRIPGERLGEVGQDLQASAPRPAVWRATGQIVRDHPLLGTGLGTFEASFPLYRPSHLRARWTHAHNDWLESAAGGGLITPLLLGSLLIGLAPWRKHRFPLAPLPLLIAGSAYAGILAIALHSLVDFGLRIPANAVLLAFLSGLVLAALREPAPD